MIGLLTLRRAAILGPALIALAFTGCGGGTGNVSGKVTYMGKPVVSGSVVFYGENKLPIVGAIDEQGNYKVIGVPSGLASITVNSPDPAMPQNALELGGKAPKPTGGPDASIDAPKSKDKTGARPPGWRALPPQYGDATTSKLSLEVSSGENTFDIKLE